MSFEVAKEKAIRYIALSRKTSYEVKTKLSKIGVDEDIIDKVIEYLIDLDYINDKEYVDAYVRQCMRLQSHSIYEIKNKLLQKGIKKDIIENKLDKLSNTDYEEKIIISSSTCYGMYALICRLLIINSICIEEALKTFK